MAIPFAAISAGIGVASKLFGKKNKKGDLRGAIARLRASRPVGYLTPEDLRAAEISRGRINEGVNASAGQEGYEIGRRFQARGLKGSPSEERARARLEQQKLLGNQNAATSAEEQLYNIRTGREAFERQKALDIFGAEAGQAQRDDARAQAENAGFWNSINEFIPTIQKGLDAGSAAGAGAGSTTVGFDAGSGAGLSHYQSRPATWTPNI
jgi:hypothetical protein